MSIPSPDWLPIGRSMSLLPAGKWWDAVKVPRTIALEALGRLAGEAGGVIEDPWADIYYWLVPAGEASTWELPKASRITVLGDTAHVVVPGPECTEGPRWRIPPTDSNALTDPARLHDVLARAAAIVAELSPDEAYRALVAHYGACPGCAHAGQQCGERCAHDIEPCPRGRHLRQAWVGVRWS
jgi:hypothetical protein